MAGSGVRLLVAAALMCLLAAAAAPSADAAITCGQVAQAVGNCLGYIRAGGPLPPPACCNGVRSLNAAARSTPDRQATCGCLKRLATTPGINMQLVAGLPTKCGVNVPYPINPNTDCSRIR